MIKIGFFVLTLNKGGLERVVNNLTNQLSNDYDITIYTFFSSNVAYDFNNKIKIIHIGKKYKRNIFNIFYWKKKIISATEDLDIIVSFGDKLNKMLLMFNKHKKPIIISERNNPKVDNRSFLSNILDKILYQKSDKIVFQTEEVKKMYSKKIQNKSVVINNPVINGLPKSTRSKNVIFTIGRLTKQKNQALLIKAFKSILLKHPEYKLIILGDGELKDDLVNLAHSLNINQSVEFAGTRDQIHDFIKDFKIFVLPSFYEGQSNALLEAYLMGIPSIGSNTIGINSIITNKVTGLLFENNSKDDLINKLTYAIENYNSFSLLADNAVKDNMLYDLKNITKQWREIFENLSISESENKKCQY